MATLCYYAGAICTNEVTYRLYVKGLVGVYTWYCDHHKPEIEEVEIEATYKFGVNEDFYSSSAFSKCFEKLDRDVHKLAEMIEDLKK